MKQKVELLAPAGNINAFYGAVKAGADAVYLAGNRFGARAYAENFTTEELLECIRYAHLFRRKVYLTVNTLIKEEEFPELYPYLKPFYEAGLDGVIVQDIGALQYMRDVFPGMELHVSTQMTITSEYGVKFLQKMGAVRVVPARELCLKELHTMKEHTGIDLETFIHGAMCYCYSGQCLFSSILGGRSGNRGRCAQPCRLPYKVQIGEKKYPECFPLSLKDMCTIEYLPEFIENGIDSFKIEGRMKKPEYAAGVTAIYRKYIDRYYAGEAAKVSRKDSGILSGLYIRSQVQDGYYYRHNGREMITLDNPSYSKNDEEGLEAIRQDFLQNRMKIKLHIKALFLTGQQAQVSFACINPAGPQITVYGEQVVPAQKQPIAEENIRRQLLKLGESVFESESLEIEVSPDAFYPLKALNELRRMACIKLEEAILRSNKFTARTVPAVSSLEDSHGMLSGKCLQKHAAMQSANSGNYHILVTSLEQFQSLLDLLSQHIVSTFPKELIVEADLLKDLPLAQIQNLKEIGIDIRIALPAVLRDGDRNFLEEIRTRYDTHNDLFSGFLVRSFDGLGFLKQKSWKCGTIAGDAGLYMWNSHSLKALQLHRFCMPYELKASEQHRLLESADVDAEKVIYGRIPLMVTANCINKTLEGCKKNLSSRDFSKDPVWLTDRYQKRFPVKKDCLHCTNTIYNCLPLCLHKEIRKWTGYVDFRINFTIETYEETKQILLYFLNGAEGEPPIKEYTTGHEKRGVE